MSVTERCTSCGTVLKVELSDRELLKELVGECGLPFSAVCNCGWHQAAREVEGRLDELKDEIKHVACVVASLSRSLKRADKNAADLAAERDCGQAGVCAKPPGCQRHWAERNAELVVERDAALAKVAALEKALAAAAKEEEP